MPVFFLDEMQQSEDVPVIVQVVEVYVAVGLDRSRSMFLLSHHMSTLGRPCSTFSRVTPCVAALVEQLDPVRGGSRRSRARIRHEIASASRTCVGTFIDGVRVPSPPPPPPPPSHAHQLGPVGPERGRVR